MSQSRVSANAAQTSSEVALQQIGDGRARVSVKMGVAGRTVLSAVLIGEVGCIARRASSQEVVQHTALQALGSGCSHTGEIGYVCILAREARALDGA